MDLTDKVALITGGKRIGLVVARELAARGVDVALSYARSQAEAEQAVGDVRAAKRRGGGVSGRSLAAGRRCAALVAVGGRHASAASTS